VLQHVICRRLSSAVLAALLRIRHGQLLAAVQQLPLLFSLFWWGLNCWLIGFGLLQSSFGT
jgi:hypothetical protein